MKRITIEEEVLLSYIGGQKNGKNRGCDIDQTVDPY